MIKKCVILSLGKKGNANSPDDSLNLNFSKILGLTPLERIILSAKENGVHEFFVLTDRDDPSFY